MSDTRPVNKNCLGSIISIRQDEAKPWVEGLLLKIDHNNAPNIYVVSSMVYGVLYTHATKACKYAKRTPGVIYGSDGFMEEI